MSWELQSEYHGELYANFIGPNPIVHDGVVIIGEYEITLENFCEMLEHYLTGGLFGWSGHTVPEPVQKLLTRLHDHYTPKQWSPVDEFAKMGQSS